MENDARGNSAPPSGNQLVGWGPKTVVAFESEAPSERTQLADVPRGKVPTKPGIRVLWDQMLKLEAVLGEARATLDEIRSYLLAHDD